MTTLQTTATIDQASHERWPNPRVSVIGMGMTLPEADDPTSFWRLIRSGDNTFRAVDPLASRRWGYRQDQVAAENFVPVTSSLRDPDRFDAEFFGIPSHEARLMDPQHRLMLETVWSALEDSGHAGDYGHHTVGLFASVTPSTYLTGPLTRAGLWDPSDPNYGILLGNDKDFAATRTAYSLGFTGPCMTIQTACSSSLVAVHTAIRSLITGECDIAIVAGSSISVPHLGGYFQRSGSIFSPSGTCRPFDARSDGTLKGNGAVAVVLRLSDLASLDGDRSYADLLGSAVSNDGRAKAGFAAPGVDGQEATLRAALGSAGLDAQRIRYVETHGTGTTIGDPLEIRALDRAHAGAESPCTLGSLKGTMGHLDAAAGVAGLAKTALVAHHREIPPMPGLERPNPLLNIARTRFVLPQEVTAVDHVVAGVSSFGMGGTNAHVILESVASPKPTDQSDAPVELVVHGQTQSAALEQRRLLSEHLSTHPEANLADVAFTLESGRRADRHQIRLNARTVDEAVAALQNAAPKDLGRRPAFGEEPQPSGVVGRRTSLPQTTLSPQAHWVDEVVEDVEVASAQGALTNDLPQERSIDELTVVVARLMGSLLHTQALGPDDDFFLAGADSLLGIDLVGGLRDEVGVALEYSDLEEARTPRALAQIAFDGLPTPGDLVTRDTQDTRAIQHTGATRDIASGRGLDTPMATVDVPTSHLSRGGGRKLFLVHPAGGTTACYVELARLLSDDLDVIGLGFPSEMRGRAPSIRDLARHYVSAILRLQPGGSILLGGYSFGGNLAVEMALQLDAAGVDVDRLVLIDAHPPHAYIGGRTTADAYLQAFPELLRSVLGERVEIDESVEWTTPDAVIGAVRTPRLTEAVQHQLRAFYDVWCDNHAALKSWLPDARPTCPTVVLEATVPEPPEVLELLAIQDSRARDWRDYVDGPVSVLPIEGDHYSIFRSPHALQTMVEVLNDAVG